MVGNGDVEVSKEIRRTAKLETCLRESRNALLTPLAPMTDQLMFRKMKTDPNPQDTKQPLRLMRFVLLLRVFPSSVSDRELTLVFFHQTKTPQQRANELREKLLKERIKKMRSTSSSDNVNG